nr:MAG: capsid protein [Canine stool-associated circular genome virus]
MVRTRRYRISKRRSVSTRSRRGRGLRKTAYRRTRRSSSRSGRTSSKTIKLTYDGIWQTKTDNNFNAFSFTPSDVPGFIDYAAVYSHFRIKKCLLMISRQRASSDTTGFTDNYLVVGSRPFAALVAPQALSDTNPNPGGTNLPPTAYGNAVPDYRPSTLVPAQQEGALRQTRWQHKLTPNSTKPYIHIGFYPYTMVGTFGPSGSLPANPLTSGSPAINAVAYQRVWEARKWMPFTWAGGTAGTTYPCSFFGPYLMTDAATTAANGEISGNISINVTLTLYCQFKGQK